LGRTDRRASILAMTLIVTSVVAMMALAMVTVNRNLLLFSGRSRDDLTLVALTEGAINRALEQLGKNAAFAGTLSGGTPDSGYSITFNSASSQRSVNNLLSDANSATSNFLGQTVGPRTVDLCVLSTAGRMQRQTHVVLRKGISFPGAMGADEGIFFQGACQLDAIRDMASRQAVPAQIHSNATGSAVQWTAPNTSFQILNQCKLTAVGTVDPSITAANPGKTEDSMPPIAVPDVDVQQVVTDNSGHPALVVPPVGSVVVSSPTYRGSDLVINGDLNLYDGSLYVDGDVTINGGISGYGSLFASGNVTVNGGSAVVVTNQVNGAAVFSGGNFTLQGLSAGGYLTALAAADATVNSRLATFVQALRTTQRLSQNGGGFLGADADFNSLFGAADGWLYLVFPGKDWAIELWWAKYKMAGSGPGPGYASPLLSPKGIHPYHAHGAVVPQLIQAIKALPAYSGDTKAQQIVHGLDQVAYYFRHNWDAGQWDYDETTTPVSMFTLDHQIWLTIGMMVPNAAGTFPGVFTEAMMAQGVNDFFEFNDPLDLSWLGKSYLQGLVYARGGVTLQGDSQIYGVVISKGALHLTNSTFVYDQEYQNLAQRVQGPLRVVLYQEI